MLSSAPIISSPATCLAPPIAALRHNLILFITFFTLSRWFLSHQNKKTMKASVLGGVLFDQENQFLDFLITKTKSNF